LKTCTLGSTKAYIETYQLSGV